jgi:hypothetical protein
LRRNNKCDEKAGDKNQTTGERPLYTERKAGHEEQDKGDKREKRNYPPYGLLSPAFHD